ncbi:DUF4252 domain-containing protein [Flavobacteriaceae bacterium AU392]|nr:DUF4252 domain-containing protein [Flavobacteriaceae bacterium]RKM83519.1 DUF4252 domain-containing protein [Flavobacteriaceae bacterium AU392]
MNSSIKNLVKSLLIVIVLTSCDYGETLQAYFVTKQETPNFISIDIPTSFVNIDKVTLTKDQEEAYESIDKLNMLGYTISDDNIEEYNTELEKVNLILKDERYQELLRAGNTTDGKIVIKYIGTETEIDELIIFGSATDRGFAIVRVLGNNMKPAQIMTLGDVIQDLDSEENNVQDFMKFFQ